MNSGILGDLEFSASAECELQGDEIIATTPRISVYIPGISGKGTNIFVTHLISEDELDTITEKIMEAYIVRLENREPESSYN